MISAYFRQFLCQHFCTSSWRNALNKRPFKRAHVPVLAKETMTAFRPKDGQVFLDMTFGSGGHSELLLNSANITLLALDRDPRAIELAYQMKDHYGDRLIPLLGKFSDLPRLLHVCNIQPNSIDGVLIDAGCSSMQLDNPDRGFSLSKDGPLDMRMDGNRLENQPNAADVVNTLNASDLAKIFLMYGEEKHSAKIAREIIEARHLFRPLRRTKELADLIAGILHTEHRHDMLGRQSHPATKVFQALRIFVNNELNELNYGLEIASNHLRVGGRLVTLSFHSLEDRIFKRNLMGIDLDEPVSGSIKQRYHNAAHCHEESEILEVLEKKWKPIYKDIVTPSSEEVEINPRSRSAKLRASIKVS